jgi:hypothetical protein
VVGHFLWLEKFEPQPQHHHHQQQQQQRQESVSTSIELSHRLGSTSLLPNMFSFETAASRALLLFWRMATVSFSCWRVGRMCDQKGTGDPKRTELASVDFMKGRLESRRA